MLADVPAESPEAEEIALVAVSGLMTAEDGSFRPDASLTRQEAAQVLVRLAERYRSAGLEKKEAKLEDAESIDPTFRDDVAAAVSEGFLKADEGRVRPTANMTRGELAAALFALFDFPWSHSASEEAPVSDGPASK